MAIYNYAFSAGQVLNHYIVGTNPVVSLYITKVGGNVILNWAPGTLQSASSVTGPFTDMPTATSPFTNAPSGSQKYFRVRVR